MFLVSFLSHTCLLLQSSNNNKIKLITVCYKCTLYAHEYVYIMCISIITASYSTINSKIIYNDAHSYASIIKGIIMNRRLHMLIDISLYDQAEALAGKQGVSEFVRQAIQEKIESISQQGKNVKAMINQNNQVDVSKLEEAIATLTTQNKVLFEQQQKQQELMKLILRRATVSSVSSGLHLGATNKEKSSEVKSIVENMLTDDLSKLNL